MQDAIIDHLREKYKPDAIILHGSRARGKEREHSDWDFIFLYNSPGQGCNGREMFNNQNIEFSSHAIPVNDIEEEFSIKLRGAKVVYEAGTIGTDLLNEASMYYEQGVYWSAEKINNHRLWAQGRIDGMRDNIGNPLIFTKYFTDFYQKIFNYWYWILQHSHSQPVYVAVEEIERKDPEFYVLLKSFASSDSSLEEKVEIAEKIKSRLFQ